MEMEIFISVVLLAVGIAILVVVHVCIVSRAFRGSPNGGGNIVGERRSFSRSSRMSQEDIKKLPCFDYNMVDQEKGGNNNNGPLDCAVCLENFKVGDKCRLLPNCKHSFHAVCVDSWLLRTGGCPICRASAAAAAAAAASHLSPDILEENSDHHVHHVVEFTEVR